MNDLPASERHFTTHHLCMLWVPEMHAYLYIKPGAVPNPCHLLTVCQQKDRSVGLDRKDCTHVTYLQSACRKMGVLAMLRELPTHRTTSPFSWRIFIISCVAVNR